MKKSRIFWHLTTFITMVLMVVFYMDGFLVVQGIGAIAIFLWGMDKSFQLSDSDKLKFDVWPLHFIAGWAVGVVCGIVWCLVKLFKFIIRVVEQFNEQLDS